MFMTIEKPNGMRLVLDVHNICYLGPSADINMVFRDFVADATVRFATEEEMLYFANPSEELQ